MLADMSTLKDFPEIYQVFIAGNFATQLTSVGKFVIKSCWESLRRVFYQHFSINFKCDHKNL